MPVSRLDLRRIHTLTFCKADHVTNLREDILIHRLKYSMTTIDDANGEDFIGKGAKALEK